MGCEFEFAAFLGMNRREEELEDLVIMPSSMTALSLGTAYDPEAAFFGLFERVHTPHVGIEKSCVKDDLYTGIGTTTATMHDLCTDFILESEENLIETRINVAVSYVGFAFH